MPGSTRPAAFIAESARLAEGIIIGREAYIGEEVIIGPGTQIGQSSSIGNRSTLQADILVGPDVQIGEAAIILAGAHICPNTVQSASSDGRKLEYGVTVGPGVVLHDEVELADWAVVPTQRTIMEIGKFGTKGRVVTIYGSDEGPRYSIGCQIGVDFGTVRERVAGSTCTTGQSSSTYAPYLDVFQAIGREVQGAYEGETRLVDELKAYRLELGLF